MLEKKCPICDLPSSKILMSQIKDDIDTNVFECEDCHFQYLETWDDVEYVKSLYEGDKYVFTHNVSSEKSAEELGFDEYEERLRWMKPYLNGSKEVLEIGCGDGKFMRMLKPFIKNVEGLELSPPQVERLRKEGFTCYDKMIGEIDLEKKYDVVCFFAVLEHIPNVKDFLSNLKKIVHKETQIFIEVPHVFDALVSGYSIEEFRKFYYRSIHLYYFNIHSLSHLLEKCGYQSELHTSQQASITNHFHWVYNRCGQPNANSMTSVTLPVELSSQLPIKNILQNVDHFYRQQLVENHMGDLLSARLQLK